MSSVNPLTKEIVLKLVYYGPGLGGKTTTLQHIHRTARPEHRGKMVSLATPVDRTLYFDFLPVRLPRVGGYTLRLQLFTVPGQVHYNATRKLVLTGADGVVFVADSQRSRMDANIESLENLADNLAERGIDLGAFPLIFQYNKRDIPGIMSVDELERRLNPGKRPHVETCAVSGEGVYQGLEAITKEVLRELKRRDVLARGREGGAAMRDGQALSFQKEERGIQESVRQLSETEPERSAATRAPDPAAPKVDTSPIPAKVRSPSPQPSVPTEGTEPVPPSFSLADLWPEAERATPMSIEGAIAQGRHREAASEIWRQIGLVLQRASEGLADRTPAAVIGLLGLNGRDYVDVARLAREAESGSPISRDRLLRAYLFLLATMRAATS